MMTTRARRPTFTTNRQRGNAGSPTLNHTTITRAGPSASLGDDPLIVETPYTPRPPPTHKQTVHYEDYTHPIWE